MRERYIQRDKQILDLVFLTILAVFSEVAGNGLLKLFPNTGYRMSLAPFIYFIALIRWGIAGGVVGISSNLSTIFFLKNSMYVNILMGILPSLLLLLPFFFIDGSTRDKIGRKISTLSLTLILFYLVLSVGYGFVTCLSGGSFLGGVIDSFFPKTLDLLISFIIIKLMNERKLIFQNMEKYLEKSKGGKKGG